MDAASGRLRGADWRASPNHDARPDPADIALVVIHNISLPPEQFGGGATRSAIDDLFQNRLDPQAHPYFAGIHELRVSAHLCLFRDGVVAQYVGFNERAWHAGASQWQGRSRCNDFSIGIELEGSDTQPFESQQYRQLAAILRVLFAAYPQLDVTRLTGHSDIAPGRKTDPGPHFDWARLRSLLAAR